MFPFSDLGQQQAATPSEVSISKVVPIHFSPMRNSTSPTLSCHNDSIMVWNDHHHKICIRWPTSSVFLPLASFYDHSLWSNSDSDTNKHTNSFTYIHWHICDTDNTFAKKKLKIEMLAWSLRTTICICQPYLPFEWWLSYSTFQQLCSAAAE